MNLLCLLVVAACAALAAVASPAGGAEKEVIFQDDFNRDNADTVGGDWSLRGKVALHDRAALFTGQEEEFRPRMSHRFPLQKAGKITASFVMDWLRESEGTWAFHMQLGHSADIPRLLVYNRDLSKGMGVNLVWGGGELVNFQPRGSFGYLKDGKFHPLLVANNSEDEKTVVKEPVVTIEIDLDASTYSVSFNGKTYPDLPFDNQGPIDTIRFISNGCSAMGFAKSSIDDVQITRGK